MHACSVLRIAAMSVVCMLCDALWMSALRRHGCSPAHLLRGEQCMHTMFKYHLIHTFKSRP